MNIQQGLNLMVDIRKAEKDPKTPIGAARSMQDDYLKKEGVCTIGPLLPDERFALYAQSETKTIPEEWCRFPVVNTGKANENRAKKE